MTDHTDVVGVAPPAAVALEQAKRRSANAKATDLFDFQLRCNRCDGYVREHTFHETRRWRLDFAWPLLYLAVEIEGLVVQRLGGILVVRGRHASISGFKEDCIKYAEAACLGWTVLRFEQSQVKDLTALDFTIRALHRARSKAYAANAV